MRTLPSLIATEVAKTITRPIFLARIQWQSGVSYLSSGGTVSCPVYLSGSYVAATWTGGTLGLTGLRSLTGGGMEATLTLSNTDDAVAALVLARDPAMVRVMLWQIYGAGPFADGDAIQLFTGYVDSVEILPTRVTLACVTDSRRRMYAPRLAVTPPTFRHLPPKGTRILWGGELYELRGAD